MTNPRLATLLVARCLVWTSFVIAAPAHSGGLTLRADDAPVNTPWTEPATLAVTRQDGSNTVTADLVLKYRSEVQVSRNTNFARNGSYSAGVYLHRDSTSSAPKNDRGLSLGYAGLLVPDFGNAGPVGSLGYSVKLNAGKSLVEVEDAAGTKSWVDKTKLRLVAGLGGYVQPAIGGSPQKGVVPAILYFDGGPSLYVDQSRGNGVKGTGRLTGGQLKLGANYAPLGLEPTPVAGLAMVPTLRLAAQLQRDFSATDSRTKQTRKLYSLELNLLFARPDDEDGKFVPSLQLARSVGADLLTGRSRTAKTELSLGLTF
jgi:hypothetical protein